MPAFFHALTRLAAATLVAVCASAPAQADTVYKFRARVPGLVVTPPAGNGGSAVAPTLSGFSVASRTYGDGSFVLTAPTSNSAGSWSYSSSDAAIALVSGDTVAIAGAGTVTLTATQAATASYTAGSISAVFTVAQATPALGAFNLTARSVGDPPFTLTAPSSSSPGAWAYASSNPAVASVSGDVVTVLSAGTTTITATQAATANYTGASTSGPLAVAVAYPANYRFAGGLVWSVPDGTMRHRSEADAYCGAFNVNGTGWRVPTRTEVDALLLAFTAAELRSASWPSTAYAWILTSTAYNGSTNWVYAVDGTTVTVVGTAPNGSVSYDYQGFLGCVRAP